MADRAGRDFTHHRHLVTGVTRDGDNAAVSPTGHVGERHFLQREAYVTSITIMGDSDHTRARSFAFECSHCWWGNAIQFHVQFGSECFELARAKSLRL
jgi:hypothetical protein